jgi:hypothetical protein
LYPANPDPPLSLEPVQLSVTDVAVVEVVPRPLGVVGTVESDGGGVIVRSPPPGRIDMVSLEVDWFAPCSAGTNHDKQTAAANRFSIFSEKSCWRGPTSCPGQEISEGSRRLLQPAQACKWGHEKPAGTLDWRRLRAPRQYYVAVA